jgi:PAS domain S-box-containing protein
MLRKLGILKTLILLAALATISSVLMYVIIGFFIGSIASIGMVMAAVIPATTAPAMLYYLLSLVYKLDLTEEALRKSEKKYRHLVKYAPAGIYEIDLADLKFIDVNDVMCEYTGYSQAEFLALNPFDLLTEESRQEFRQRQQRVLRGRSLPETVEYKIRGKNGREFWVLLNTRLMRDVGKPTSATVVVYDITERKRIEDQIRTSLREKEVLLQEIHHRLKNNMQVISSLLSLQSNYVNDPRTFAIFQDSQNRVRSMALVHEKLYRSQDLTRIDFSEYIQELAVFLFQAQQATSQQITLNIEADQVFIDLDQAIPCGLILNELISNALKHGFPDGNKGELRVWLKTSDPQQLNLIVADNGIGLPAHVDIHSPDSLGLQLVNSLVNQLGGTVEFRRKAGTEVQIKFVAAP